MIDQDFYSHLEFHLTNAFPNSDNDLITSFWCDGILPASEEEISSLSNNNTKEIRTTGFIGNDGQERYEMTIFFGPKTLTNYSQGLELKDCMPNPTENNWFDIDLVDKKVLIRLP